MDSNSFESKLSRAAEIADLLGRGELPLSESIELYKEALETLSAMKQELETAKESVVVMRKGLDGVYFEEEVAEIEF